MRVRQLAPATLRFLEFVAAMCGESDLKRQKDWRAFEALKAQLREASRLSDDDWADALLSLDAHLPEWPEHLAAEARQHGTEGAWGRWKGAWALWQLARPVVSPPVRRGLWVPQADEVDRRRESLDNWRKRVQEWDFPA